MSGPTTILAPITRERDCIYRVEYKGDVEICKLDGTECVICHVLPLLDEMGRSLNALWQDRPDYDSAKFLQAEAALSRYHEAKEEPA
jgi:hypothetical protein